MNEPVIAKPAASIMVIRDGETGLEVLMMRRSEKLAFAPGAFVFPGGKVDRSDQDVIAWRRLVSRHRYPDFGFRMAALRELYEEVGVLYTEKPPIHAPRMKTVTTLSLQSLLRRRKGILQVHQLVPFAQWVTPEGIPRRYDTHFYLAPLKTPVHAVADGSEAISLSWVNPRHLLSQWEEGGAPLMFPTRLNLMKLARADTVSDALLQAQSASPVRVTPVISGQGEFRTVTIPESAGFGVTAATPKELRVEAPRKA